jgi:hypothetical protein
MGALRNVEQKSPGNAGSDSCPYAMTGTERCMAIASSTNPERRFSFIAGDSSSQMSFDS